MVTIRLSRVGRKKQPSFRIIVSEKKRDVFGHSLEIVGQYHPRAKDKKDELVVNTERIEYWLSKGAKLSDTMHNFLVRDKVIEGKKVNVLPKKKPTVKRKELKVKK